MKRKDPQVAEGADSSSPAVKRPRGAIVASVLVLCLALGHMFLTAVVNIPDRDIKYEVMPGELADAYTNPLLTQNYRIFAPNPASEDRALWVRAWIELPDGERVETEWINATAVELSPLYRKVLRKHLTVTAAERYMSAYRSLNDAQREILAGSNFHRAGDRERMREQLTNEGPASDYLRMDAYVTGFSTQVALAMHGEQAEILAVQSRVVYSPVVRWADRDSEDATAPASYRTHEGWREPIVHEGQDSEEFARSFLRWLEHEERDGE